MAPLTLLASREKKQGIKLNKNSRIFKTIINALQEKKAENIISLDLRKIHEAIADFFVICEAGNPQHVRAIAEFVEEEVKKHCDELPYQHEGYQALQWVLIDYVNIVVHVMLPETRKFYRLEDMWSDALSNDHIG